MRIPVQPPITRTIAASLTHAFMVGQQEGRIEARLGRCREFEPAGLTSELLLALDRDGFDIVRKPDDRPLTAEDFTGPITLERGVGAPQVYVDATPGMSSWVLRGVIPGTIDIRPSTTVADHEVTATATAVLTKADLSDRRELTVRTAWFCSENLIESATTEALSLALRQARDAAAAFIAATSPAPVNDTEEAA